MNELLGSIWWLIVSLGILVTFHEFGHYWVARRCGVRVLRFSVGFGRPLWSRTGADGTEYCVAAIPLGGYVKMLDEREGEVAPSDLHLAFNRKPVLQRMAVVIAGPVANLVLCVLMLWGMFVIGRPDFVPMIGRAEGLAASAGLHAGDTVLAIGDRPTPTWSEAEFALIPAALDRHDVDVRVRTGDGDEATRRLRLSELPASIDELRAVEAIGIAPRHQLVPARVGKILPGYPATGVLQDGDLITAIDGQPVHGADDVAPLVDAVGRGGETAMIEVQRGGERLAWPMRPVLRTEEGKTRWMLGMGFAQPSDPVPDAVLRYGPLQAVPAAIGETAHQAHELVAMLGRALLGRVDVRNTVAGPITIARAANAYASHGPAWYLSMLAMLSLSLAILNLLPIPILDGGHLLYYLIELIKGRPVSDRAMAAGQFVGLAIIVGLMGLAFYNDIVNNLVR
ncbi:RIP metalloprotease RseP [Lysobacter sp. TY2-98]|uniref:RIP metalloprotease RseP n=1 Tax=Lysobacter sp. TY2-98 TaxID=2290922 RepID=UPI000E202600|nr:RIP metalloprotease RseP [Lysobacter sp. TY2-98]AXK71578.1 RIP metalloprotease RseP [Lysobacter sp. TY2-98]